MEHLLRLVQLPVDHILGWAQRARVSGGGFTRREGGAEIGHSLYTCVKHSLIRKSSSARTLPPGGSGKSSAEASCVYEMDWAHAGSSGVSSDATSGRRTEQTSGRSTHLRVLRQRRDGELAQLEQLLG